MLNNNQDRFSAIQIETIHGCNLNCKTCPNSIIKKQMQKMDVDLYIHILEELKKINYDGRISPYLMNEPSLDNRLVSFIKMTREMFPDNVISIGSNGIGLSRSELENYFEAGLTSIVLTFYDKDTHENFKDMIDDKTVRAIYAYKNPPEFFMFNRGGNIKLGEEHEIVNETCSKGTKQAFINHLGQMIICCSDYYFEVVAGNVWKTPILDLYNCEEFKDTREKLNQRIRRGLRLCEKCNCNRPQQRLRKNTI